MEDNQTTLSLVQVCCACGHAVGYHRGLVGCQAGGTLPCGCGGFVEQPAVDTRVIWGRPLLELLTQKELELSALRKRLAEAERERDRWRHGVPIEGDYVCPDSLRADAAEATIARVRKRADALCRWSRDHLLHQVGVDLHKLLEAP